MMKAVGVIGLALAVLSCASVDVYRVQNANGSTGKQLAQDDSGIRFYRPAPHVWITRASPSDKVNTARNATVDSKVTGMQKTDETIISTAEVGYSAQLVMLPDYSQEYVVQWSAGLGSVTPNVTLTEGWNVTAFNSTVNSSGAAMLDSTLGKSITAYGAIAAAAAASLASDANFRGAGLYRLDVDASGKYSLGAQVFPLQ